MNFKSLRRLTIPSIICLAIVAVANASPLSSYNSPGSYYDAVNSIISAINSSFAPAAPLVTCTTTLASANATCNGLRIQPSVSTITTATNGVVSNAITVNDTSVTAASQVFCQTIDYTGVGVPADVNIVAAANSFTFQIQNTSVSGSALNATVPSTCMVNN